MKSDVLFFCGFSGRNISNGEQLYKLCPCRFDCKRKIIRIRRTCAISDCFISKFNFCRITKDAQENNNTKLTVVVQSVNLRMYSTAFLISRKCGKRGRRSNKWSYKLNRPDRCYQVVRDGRGRVRCVWGGYGPKTHESTFLEMTRESVAKELWGSKIVAEKHLSKGNRFLRSV